MESDLIQPLESRFGLKTILLLLVSLLAVSAAAQPADSLLKASEAWEAQHRYRRAAETMDQLVKLEPTNAAYLDRRGRLLHFLDENDRAMADLKRAQALDGPSAERYYQMALIQSRVSDAEGTAASVREGLKLDAKRANFYVIQAEMALGEKKNKEAGKHVAKALKLEPNNPWARHTTATLAFRDGREAEGKAIYEANVRDNPHFPITRVSLGIFRIQESKDYNAAAELLTGVMDPRYAIVACEVLRNAYDETIEQEPDAPRQRATLEYIERCLDEKPHLPALRNWVIERWAKAGDTARARRQTELMLQHLNGYPAARRNRDLNILTLCFAADCGDEARAVAVIDSLAAIGGVAKEASLSLKANAYLARKKYAAAETILEQLFIQQPKNEELFKLRAENIANMGKPELGVQMCDQALAANDQCAYCYFTRGLFRFEAADSAGSLSDLEEAKRLGCEELGLLNNRGLLLFHYKRDTAAALADYEASIAKYPDFAYAYNNKGYVLLQQGKTQEALAIINQSLQLDAGNSEAFYYRALVYEKLGQREEACADIDNAMNAMLAQTLGKALNQAGAPMQATLQSQGRSFPIGGGEDEAALASRLNPNEKALLPKLAEAKLRLCPQD